MKVLRREEVPIAHIKVSEFNVRKTNSEEDIDLLASSIKKIGLLQPIILMQTSEDEYEIIVGQRRFLACKKLGFPSIPAVIVEVKNRTEAVVGSFSENIQRVDLEYRDKMEVATYLRSQLKSVKKVAEYLGVSSQTVNNYLGYQAVPEKVKKLVDEKRISPTTASNIARNIEDEDLQYQIAMKIREVPRSEKRLEIIEAAKLNPEKSIKEIEEIAERRKTAEIRIHLTERIADALNTASKQYRAKREDIATSAIEDWLTRRGFI